MFSGIRRLVGSVSVKQTDREILVSGIPADVMQRDIAKIWKTSRITDNMFNKIGRNEFSFNLFFAPDIVYMLDVMSTHRSRNTSVKVIATIRDEIIRNTWLANTEKTEDIPGRLKLEHLNKFIYKPLPFQQGYFDVYNTKLDQYRLNGYLLAAAAGAGKAQPLDSAIKIPGGWKAMGDVKVDDVVTAWDGTPTKVLAVYPQGVKQTFTVTFKDGRVTEACGEHLWDVYCFDWTRYNGTGWRTINTLELFSRINIGKQRLYVKLCKSEDIPDVELPIDPYNLGAILGDGGISSNCVTLTSGDPQLFSEFKKALPSTLKLITRDAITVGVITERGTPNVYIRELKALGLMGKNSYTKEIPELYMHGSTDQRIALIQGLMDTDGTIDTNGSLSFSSSSYTLAKQMQYLIRSVGGIARIKHKETSYVYNGIKKEGAISYRVSIRFHEPSLMFRLDRKRARANDGHQYCESLRLQIKSVNLARLTECQCISVEHPDHLYVTDSFVVTHNTYTTLAVGECLEADLIIVVCPNNAVDRVWASSLQDIYKADKPSFWVYAHGKPYNNERVLVVHYEGLQALLNLLPKLDLTGTVQIILDECHNLNEINSQRTQLFEQLCKRTGSKDIVFASGTPIKALGAETIPLLRCIDPMFTPDTEARYRKIFGRDGARGIDILRHRMGLISHKVEKSELKLEKPIMKPLSVVIPNGKDFTLPAIRKDMEKFIAERWTYYKGRRKEDEAFWKKCLDHHKSTLRSRQQFKEFEQYLNYVSLVSKSPDPRYVGDEIKATNAYEKTKFGPSLPKEWIKQFRDVKSVIKYTNLKIQGECLGRVLGRKRIECHVAMVPYVDFIGVCESTTKKTVVFTSFVEALEATDKHCKFLGLKPLVVYGKTNNELAQTVSRFDKDAVLNPLIATFASLSTAVPLVMADTMIMLNSPFRAYIFEQAVSRIHRLGADTQTVVYQAHLDTGDEPNISTRSADILQWSQDSVEAIMGIRSPFEVAVAMEEHAEQTLDEHVLMHRHLARVLAPFDLVPSIEDFNPTQVTTPRAFVGW
jgi:hypothetical protein